MSQPTPTSIMLVNGCYFDHLAPDPSVIDLDVLEHGLAVPRFNNQTIRPITTQEHSMRVRRIVRELGLSSAGMSAHATQLWALLHDAHEALVPWGDCLRPGKTDEMREIEAKVDGAILAADFALPMRVPSPEAINLVKTADAIALYFEAMLWQPGASDWAPDAMPWESIPNSPTGAVIHQFMPLIAPRPRESWRTEVEALLADNVRGE